jgi:hypothetical protein
MSPASRRWCCKRRPPLSVVLQDGRRRSCKMVMRVSVHGRVMHFCSCWDRNKRTLGIFPRERGEEVDGHMHKRSNVYVFQSYDPQGDGLVVLILCGRSTPYFNL